MVESRVCIDGTVNDQRGLGDAIKRRTDRQTGVGCTIRNTVVWKDPLIGRGTAIMKPQAPAWCVCRSRLQQVGVSERKPGKHKQICCQVVRAHWHFSLLIKPQIKSSVLCFWHLCFHTGRGCSSCIFTEYIFLKYFSTHYCAEIKKLTYMFSRVSCDLKHPRGPRTWHKLYELKWV